MYLNALNSVDFEFNSLKLSGFSVSGLATWLVASELDVCFDMGECPLNAVAINHVFLTHAHGDHSRCLMRHYALRKMMGIEREAVYYLPSQILPQAQKWIQASNAFENTHKANMPLPNLVGLDHMNLGDEPIGLPYRKNLSLRAFEVDHGVPSLGYTLYHCRNKLKPEYQGLTGPEIVALKKQKIEVQAPMYIPFFTFIGDCTGYTLRKEKAIWQSEYLVIESTFIGQGEEGFARQRGHTHLSEIGRVLDDYADVVECKKIILKHFSMKVRPLEALAAALQYIPQPFHDRLYLMTHIKGTKPCQSLADIARLNLL